MSDKLPDDESQRQNMAESLSNGDGSDVVKCNFDTVFNNDHCYVPLTTTADLSQELFTDEKKNKVGSELTSKTLSLEEGVEINSTCNEDMETNNSIQDDAFEAEEFTNNTATTEEANAEIKTGNDESQDVSSNEGIEGTGYPCSKQLLSYSELTEQLLHCLSTLSDTPDTVELKTLARTCTRFANAYLDKM